MRRAVAFAVITATAVAQVTYDDLLKADPKNWLS